MHRGKGWNQLNVFLNWGGYLEEKFGKFDCLRVEVGWRERHRGGGESGGKGGMQAVVERNTKNPSDGRASKKRISGEWHPEKGLAKGKGYHWLVIGGVTKKGGL